ncbi:MAG TPA: response regulator transcription factor [Pseudobdellovibrionaceae bacterium]|nr:response regulator transcription factor [Pseudobdellovibrionaceae bacterium]
MRASPWLFFIREGVYTEFDMSELNETLFSGLCLLVEDQPEVRDYIVEILSEAYPDLKTHALPNLKEAQSWLIQRSRENNKIPLTLSLIDLGLPDGSGVDLIRLVSKEEPTAKSVVITIYDDDAYLFEALSAGASGYILKEEEPEFFVEILKRLARGEPPLSPSVARRLLTHFHKKPEEKTSDDELTARERETLTLLAKGMTVAEAAHRMKLSAQTVAGYVKIIYQKLHVSNRAEATREAIRRRLV